MSNLTISVDDQLIKAARVRAIQQGTSLSAKVREFLQQYVKHSDTAASSEPVSIAVFNGQGGMAPGVNPLSNQSLLQAAEQ